MIVSRHPRPSVPYPTTPLRHFPPSLLVSNFFPLTLLADPHPLNPVVSIFYKNIGGRGYVPSFQPAKAPFASGMNLRDLPTCKRVLIYPLFFHTVVHSFPRRGIRIFFPFNHFRTLFIMTGVYPHSSDSGTHPLPLTTLIPALSFHALTKCKFHNSFVLIFMQTAGGMGGRP